LVELFVLLLQLLHFDFIVLNKLFSGPLQVLVLLFLNGGVSFDLRVLLLDLLLQVLQSFSLLLVFLLQILVVLLHPGHSLSQSLRGIFLFLANSLLKPFKGLLVTELLVAHLGVLEVDLLLHESSVSCKSDLALSILVHDLIILSLQVLLLLEKVHLFFMGISFELIEFLLFIL